MKLATFSPRISPDWDNPYKSRYGYRDGKELESETGLYYYGARYYDPSLSVWLGVDPLAPLMPGVSPYVYNFNSPVRYTDPTGMMPEENDPPKNMKNGDMYITMEGGKWEKTQNGLEPKGFEHWDLKPVEVVGYKPRKYEPSTKSTANFYDAISTRQCHHKATFTRGDNEMFAVIKHRQSRFVTTEGGNMRNDFIGDKAGKDGVVYGTSSGMTGPDGIFQINKIWLKRFADGISSGLKLNDIFESLYGDAPDVDIKTFKYIERYDTIRSPNLMGSKGRGYKPVYQIGLIINGDTIK